MLEVVENYLLLKKEISLLIKKSGYRNEFIAKKIGMAPAYFAVKKQRGNWSDDEVKRIVQLIENEEVANYFDSVRIENSFPGSVISSSDFEKIMKWK